jgi:SSS family solute:Na+ symporter
VQNGAVDRPLLTLSGLDWVVVGVFVAAILGLGFSARLRDSSVLQFLAAGRSLTLPVFVATLVSTWYGGVLGIGESVSYFGLGTWLLLGFPFYVFALIYALVLAPRVRGAEQISIPERLASRWGPKVGLMAAVLIFLLAVPAAHVLMLGTLVQALTGWSLPLSVVLATVVGTLFLYRGGLLADVRVGLLAFVMMYVGFGIIALWCLFHHPPTATFATIENKALLQFSGGSGPLVVLSFFILGAWTLVDPGFHQRVASAESPETGRRGVLVSIGFWFLFDLLTVTTGMYALALLKPLPAQPLNIFPALGQQVLPGGLKAIFVCGMIGTIVSAMVGYTLVSGATLGREGIARLRPNASDEQVKLWTRGGFVVACLVAVALALSIESVVSLWYNWSGAVVGAMLIPVAFAYSPRERFNGRSEVVLASMGLAFMASFCWLVYGLRTQNALLEVVLFKQKFSLGTLVPGLAVSALVLGLGTGLFRRER